MIEKALYPGTFDPITNGHMDMIKRISRLFPHVWILVANNPSKGTHLTFQERLALVEACVAHLPNVHVVGWSGLLAEFVKKNQIDVIVRGVRNTVDFEYERQLAEINAHLTAGIDTIFLPASPKWGGVSSTVVRDVFLHNGCIDTFVPPEVLNYLKQSKVSL